MVPGFHDAPGLQHHDAVGVAHVDSRWAITSVVRPRVSSASACWMPASLAASMLEVASSRTRTGASASNARAIAIRWRSPPDSFRPRSPTTVS